MNNSAKMPGRGSRSPKYGRDEDDLELKLRRLFDQVKSLLDNTELLPEEKAALLADCGLSATLGTDEPPAFSGRPNTGGRLDPTDIDRDLTTREAARSQKEKDYDRMGQDHLAFDGSRSLDRMFPDAARIGSAAELHKSRPRASYETKSSLDVFLGRAGARIRNLG